MSVTVHPGFLTTALALIAAQYFRFGAEGLAYALVVFAGGTLCLLAHELAHALVAQRIGESVRGIVLGPLLHSTWLAGDLRGPREEFQVAGAGPAVNLVLFTGIRAAEALVHTFAPGTAGLERSLHLLALVNFWLAMGNLIPVLPTDGGRMLKAILGHSHPRVVASRIGAKVGTLTLWTTLALLFLVAPPSQYPLPAIAAVLLAVLLERGNRAALRSALVHELRRHLDDPGIDLDPVLRRRVEALPIRPVEPGRPAYRTLTPEQFIRWADLCVDAARLEYASRDARGP